MIGQPSTFELWLYGLGLMVVPVMLYYLGRWTVSMLREDWIEPFKAYWKTRDEAELEEVEQK